MGKNDLLNCPTIEFRPRQGEVKHNFLSTAYNSFHLKVSVVLGETKVVSKLQKKKKKKCKIYLEQRRRLRTGNRAFATSIFYWDDGSQTGKFDIWNLRKCDLVRSGCSRTHFGVNI